MPAVVLANGEGGAGIRDAIECLAAGGSPLDAVEAGIREQARRCEPVVEKL